MATVKFTVPNWAQGLIARAVALDPGGVVVRIENDSTIVFLEHKTGKEHMVNKDDGHVIIT